MSNRKTILVTGGNRGIGRGLVEHFKSDHDVIYTVRREENGLPTGARYVVCDMTDESSIRGAVAGIDSVDILINNAGVFLDDYSTPTLETSIDQIIETFDVNTVGPLRVCRAVAGKMPDGGRIINVSSGMGQLSDMGAFAIGYRLSKTALNALSKVLANELRGQGISVNAICPGWVQTDMGGANAMRTIDESVAEIVQFALSDPFPTGKFLRDGQEIEW